MYRLYSGVLLFALIILQNCFSSILSQSHYSIVAPGTILSNRNYSVCVSLHDAPTPATLRLSIHSPNRSLDISQDVTLQPFETKMVNFMPPMLNGDFQYELKAEGIKGLTLDDSKKLYPLQRGGPRIYIESDKALYKPGDTVQFRVIILNEHMRVTNIDEPIRIQILDPDNNRIKQLSDIRLDRGVFASKFKLSQQPILGKWTILVHIGGKYDMKKEYTFKAEKYVLPKFSVHIEHDQNLVESDRVVRATIYGKYTYGKYVQGTLEVLLLDFMRSFDYAIKKTIEIDNGDVKANIAMDIGDLGYSQTMYLNATLREKHTNVTATAETKINIQSNKYRLTVPDSGIEFRDGKPYRLQLHVQHWNGTAVRDRTTPAKMHLQGKEYPANLDDNGVAHFDFEFQPIHWYGFSYKKSILTYDNKFIEQASYDVDENNCHLVMQPRSSADLTEPIEIDVSSNRSIPYLIYTLSGHGNIIQKEFIQLSPNQKSHRIRIKASIAMIPNSYLFVYYIINDQLNFCELTIRLPKIFENQLTLSAPTHVKPGQNITMSIKGQPNSRVSILAVDKSVLLLSSDNVLQKESIMKDLMFDRPYRQQYPNDQTYEYTPGHTSGLIIMTNAKYRIHTFRIPVKPWPSSYYPPIRTLFPETWIFKDIDINKQNTELSLKVPDTITTWIVRAFSVNDDTGFGMMDDTLDIQAFQPFFISVTLPYSVKRGEVVTIPVTIFNYLRENLKTEVTMENNNGDFEFVDEQNKALAKRQDTRNANVPGNNGKSVVFNISPKKLGNIEIRIIAKNAITSDGVSQKLKVEPEGIVHNHNQDVLLTLENDSTNKTSFQAAIPANIVPESEYLVLSVSGDIMVSTLENLDKLVAKPTGCGEQNMINLAPNILILDYLKSLGKLKNQTELVDRATNFIQTGYQQELTYRHPNGAYSVFGPKSSTENNWLTAYVTRFFIKGIKYSAIEPRIIEQGLEYLSSQQLDNGSFPHRGYLFDPAHQNQYGFTAFVMLTFLEDEIYAKKYGNVIGKGMNFLRKNIDKIQDTYSLAILANALQKSRSAEANDILEKLKSMAKEENGLKWWTNNNKKEQSANDVEITAYVLMALLEQEPTSAYLPIFNWLIKQRNSQGGFGSTQDTVVGLQALIKYAMKSSQTPDTKVKVHYLAKSDKGEIVKENVLLVDSNNELVLQKEELPRNTRSVDVMVMGSGRVYLQLSHQYYIADQSNQPTSTSTTMQGLPSPPSLSLVEHKYFTLKPKARMTSTMAMSLEICYTYRPFTEEEKLTNMVILEVQFPSGFTSNGENIESLQDEEYISRIDNQNSATKLSIYFEKLEANEEQCLIIVGDKGHDVAGLKASPIEMYDFYNDNRRSTILYELSK